ncbi:MAG: NAD(P)-binding domain-containing protein, partial [Saprospiraceae bacterium]
MKIVCIGAGRLAHQLMPALQDAGCEIVQVYNRTPESAKLLSEKLKSASFTSKIEEIRPDAEIYFLTVSDDVIKPMAFELKKIITPEALAVHCSGILELDVLPFNRRAGFYPLQSFSDNHDVSFRFIPIIITTHDDDIWIELDQIAGRLSSSVYR